MGIRNWRNVAKERDEGGRIVLEAKGSTMARRAKEKEYVYITKHRTGRKNGPNLPVVFQTMAVHRTETGFEANIKSLGFRWNTCNGDNNFDDRGRRTMKRRRKRFFVGVSTTGVSTF